ncbi:hypothetical protein GCM10022382_22180 [Microbacterium invictum]
MWSDHTGTLWECTNAPAALTGAYDGAMTTSNLPAPAPQPLTTAADDKNLLTVVEDGASCCGGTSCCGS